MKRVLLIQNTSSRNGQMDLSPVLQRLRAAGLDVDSHRTSDHDTSTDLIRSSGSDCDAVLIGGGDGTLFKS